MVWKALAFTGRKSFKDYWHYRPSCTPTCPDINILISKFSHIFSSKATPLTFCNLQPIRIQTVGDPICQRAYRTPLLKRQAISKAVDDMLTQGIIQPSCSPWASPVTLVPKADGSIRFCVDYRKLNQVTKKDRYPLPQLADIHDGMVGATIFSTIDLKSGFHQINVDPNDREKTAFICHKGLFEFVRMPFGLANGPSHFQRIMDYVFRDLLGVCVMVYIDDIVIYSKSMSEHLSHLETVFNRLSQHGLQVKAEKCKFALTEIKLLGFVLDQRGIRANPEKTSAISSMPDPRTVKQVRSFLGMTGYYRQCIPHYAELPQPLTALTKKRRRFDWNSQCQAAFDSLKRALVSDSIFRYPRVDLPYKLYTDASDLCVGAILCQTHEDGVEYVSHQHVTMGDMPLPASPMQIVALDLIGPFVASSNNNKYVLTVIDHCTGWAEAYPIPNKRSQTTEQVFHNRFVATHGCPEVLVSDNGCEFTAKHWTSYLD